MGMIKRWPVLILCLAIAPTVAGAMYKWKDADGNTHYSERPPADGAEEVKLPKAVTYTPKQTADSSGGDPEKADEAGYQELKITKPEMNETVRSNKGEVQVQFELTPTLLQGHQYKLFLDGKKLEQTITQTSVTLSGLTRGSHTVVVKVTDAKEALLLSSKSVIFHLRRESELSPDSDSSSEDNTKAYDSSVYDSDGDSTYDSDASDFKDKAAYGSDASDFKGDATYGSDAEGYKSDAKSYSSGTKATTKTYKPSYTPSYKQSN
jgi:hypothetical protein